LIFTPTIFLMKTEKVSIVIPCYNQAEYVSDAIESAINQTYEDIEVIVVNDGSTDNSREIIRKYHGIILIDQENKGLSAARNVGIAEASGKYIVTLDADDKIVPSYIEKTIGKSDIVSSWTQEFGFSKRLWMNSFINPVYENFKIRNQISCCAIFRKEIWEKLNGYDEQMRDGFEDWDFWLRATKENYKVLVIPAPLFLYRKRGVSMVNHALKHQEQIKEYMRSKGSL
jgi:glycosyltransferase involved in cell wall biosynthesis